jgi:hypothetical protein
VSKAAYAKRSARELRLCGAIGTLGAINPAGAVAPPRDAGQLREAGIGHPTRAVSSRSSLAQGKVWDMTGV